MTNDVIAVLVSDIHLSHKPPVARSAEPDWYSAMARPLKELKDVADNYSAPIICAGDVFDRWNSPPELINFAIKELPPMFAIPGQHDLPNHSMEEIHRSAFWTLVEAKIIDVGEGYSEYCVSEKDKLFVYMFPWGSEVVPCTVPDDDSFKLAVIHEYCWTQQFCYPGAPKEHRLSAKRKQLKGYDASVWGDNHIGWIVGNVCNCGGFMRRSIDQINYKPFIGLLHSDGSIIPHYLDVSKDKFLDVERIEELDPPDLTEFIEELKSLGPDSLDFRTAIEQYLEKQKMDSMVKDLVTSIIEEEIQQ